MLIMALDGSPRKQWNTSTVLQAALDGAAASGQDVRTELVHLYGYSFKGCVECFECKRIGGPSYGKCAVKDGIADLLQKTLHADALLFGSPIYFSDITGVLRCFMERLLFASFVYDSNYSSLAPKKIPLGFIYTMNVTAPLMEEMGYRQRLGTLENFAGRIFGHKPRTLYVNNTLQFKDYSKYMAPIFSEKDKLAYREAHFPEDCQKAGELGALLLKDAQAGQ